jgi:hypothetical protein
LPWAAQCRFFVNRQEKVSGIVSEHGRHDLADRRGFLLPLAARSAPARSYCPWHGWKAPSCVVVPAKPNASRDNAF